MKRLFLFLVILISFISVKAQPPLPYPYNQTREVPMIRTQDLGPYGYQQLINQTKSYGERISPNTWRVITVENMLLFNMNIRVTLYGYLQQTNYGTICWSEIYSNGFWIGRMYVRGRFVESHTYRSAINVALGRY